MNTENTPIRNNVKHKSAGRVLLTILLILVLLCTAAGIFLFVINKWEVRVTLRGDETMHLEYQEPFEDPGADAVFTGTLFDLPAFDDLISRWWDVLDTRPEVKVKSSVDTNELGSYMVSYEASAYGRTGTAHRVVIVEDTTPPEITLKTKEDHYTLPGHPYEEEGFEAVDLCDGDLTESVETREEDGVVYYTVKDRSGNTASAEREIFYDDRTAPVIDLKGGDVSFYVGESWKDSYSAEDDAEGDVTEKVKVSGSVDSSKAGTYTLTYTVEDNFGNKAEVKRKVTVKGIPVNDESKAGSGKVIYLTFDDGPGKYTEDLLATLKKYNVRATFFVTHGFPAYEDMIGKEAKAGHTVAVHTYTHDYATIYASTDAYWNDFNKMNDIIEKQTGKRTTLFRFPGGSSNTVSANYNSGIMSRLVKQAEEKGYSYYDWNVSSGDAGGTTSPSGVYSNCVAGVSGRDASVILCHDIKSYTVEAMDDFIEWALKEGYTFLPLTAYSPKAHHGVNN